MSTGKYNFCLQRQLNQNIFVCKIILLSALAGEVGFLSYVMRGQMVIAYEECMLNKECSFAILMQDHVMYPEDSHAGDEVSWHNLKLASGVQ